MQSMLQDASTNPVLPSAQDQPISPQEASSQENFHDAERIAESGRLSTDSYASRLMDDLFQDVEQLLNVEHTRLAETDKLDSLGYERSPKPAQPVLSLALQPKPLAVPSKAKDSDALQELQDSDLATSNLATSDLATKVELPPDRDRRSGNTYERLLLGIGCVSVIVSLGLWLLYQEAHRQQPMVAVAPQSGTAPEVDNQFAAYMQKSLQNIDQREQQNPQAQAGSANNPGMPTVTIPKTPALPTSNPRSATGLERIYVPVYQLPSNLYPPGTVAPLPTMPNGPMPNSIPGQPARNQVSSTVLSHKLVGVMSQGDRSVALFEVNGVTQRYDIGESIGSSGWTLVEVTKDQALIRRNGEVRSLFVGHGF